MSAHPNPEAFRMTDDLPNPDDREDVALFADYATDSATGDPFSALAEARAVRTDDAAFARWRAVCADYVAQCRSGTGMFTASLP